MKRIHKELKMFDTERPEHALKIGVKDKDLHTVFFLISGPQDTQYEGGEYIVEMKLPNDYPLNPPKLRMKTPSGRFVIDQDICASFTSYHPESWSPIHTFSTILRSFISFMTDNDDTPFIGRVDASDTERRRLAKESKSWNKLKGYNRLFC